MKSKNYFLRLLLLAALLLPGVTWSQVAKVSEYDFKADTVAYNSIVGNGGTVWSAADVSNGYATITMPFAMQYGQTSISRGAMLYVSAKGYVTTGDANMTGIVIAPLSTTNGFSNVGANTIYSKVESNKVTIEWRKLKIGNNMYSFQLVLDNMGNIKFQYGPMTLSTTAQVFAGMQSSSVDVYCVSSIDNRWDTIVPTYLSLSTTRTLSPNAHPFYDVNASEGLRYTFTQPECAKPNSFGAVPGDFNVIFNWTGNGSKYQIKYNADEDFTPMTEGTLLDNLTGSTYTLSNLPQRTTYYAYIRAFCATSGSWSAWRAVADEYFTTGCGYEPLPMVQDFTNTPECWDVLSSNSDASYTVWLSGDKLAMRAGDESNGNANNVFAVLPKFNANLNNYEIDITGYRESSTQGVLTLGYFTNINNISGFVVLDTLEEFTTSSQTIALYLTDYAAIPSGARLALRWSLNSSYWDFYVDQIVIKPQPTCFPISNLQVTDINPTSAKFTFTDIHSTSTAYQLVYGAPGFDPATATPVTITNGGVVNGLEGSTHYEAYVRPICGSEQGTWVGPVDFFTPCPSVTVSAANPFKEEFNSDELPNCWSMEAFSSSEWFFSDGQAYGSSSSCGTDCEAWLYTPVFSFGTGDIILSFKHKQQDWGGDQNYLTVYYRTSPSDEWHQIVQYTNSISDMTNEEMILPNTANASQYQLAFTSTNDYGYAVYLDDIKVRPAPNCAPATNLAISPSKVLTWTAGNATQWQVRYAIAGSDNYTFVGANAATVTLPLTGEAGTQFEISVRSICGVGDTNDWSDPVFFTMPLSLPYSCDFENGATGFITQSTASNEWVLGTAKSNGGSYGYYVSNDGASNAYSHGNNIAYAYVTLPFETAGDYIVKYDWTANGESTWDFLRVALVPDNVTLITSYNNSYNSTTPSGWIAIDGGSKLNLNTNWNTRTEAVTITEPGNYKLVFAWMNDGSGGSQPPAAIDNVSVRMLSCNMPTNIALNSDGAVTWTAGTTTQWQVRWAEDGSSNYTQAFVSTPSYTSSSWAPNTSYTIDIRSICGANDTLDWATFDFTMPCMAQDITNEPFYEDFESYASGWGNTPQCWNFLNQSASSTTYPQAYTYTSSTYAVSGKCLYFKSSSTTPIYVALPRFTSNINSLQMEFYYRNEGTSASNGTLSLGVMTNPNDPSTYTNIQTFDRTTTKTRVAHIFAADGLTGNNYYIVFKYEGGSSNNYYLGIDNVLVEVIPTCPKPSNLAASLGSDGLTATLAWQENSAVTAAKSEILYGPAGCDLDNDGVRIMSTSTTAVLNNLDYVQSYDWKVRSICTVGSDTSDWSDVSTFTVPCPNGGSTEVTGTTESSNYTLPVNTYYNYSYTQQIITAAEIGGAKTFAGISFNYQYSSPNTAENSDVTIYIGTTEKSSFASNTDYVDPSSLTVVYQGSLQCNLGWNDFMFNSPFVYNGTDNIVIALYDSKSGYSGSSYKFYMQSTSSAMSLAYYSDSYTPDPTNLSSYTGSQTTYSYRNHMKLIAPCDRGECAAPSLAIATSSDELEATLTFTDNNNETSPVFYYKWGAQGFDPAGATEYSTTNTTATLTGLQSLEKYDVYVYVKCGGVAGHMVLYSFTQPFVPNCFTPTTVAVSNVTNSSATFGWNAHNNTLEPANGWEVRYRVNGSTDEYTTLPVAGTATSVDLNNLTGNTTYEIQVRAICSSIESSEWTEATTFTTLCDAYTVTTNEPYIYGFEDATGSGSAYSISPCWVKHSSSATAYPYPSSSNVSYNTDPLTSTNSYCLYMYGTTSYYSYAVLPTFTNSLTDLQISLKVLRTSSTATYGKVQIGVMTDPDDVSTFQLVQEVQATYTSPYTWQTFEIPLNTFTGNPGRLAIMAPNTGTNYVYVDDIEVSLLPPCVKPSNAHTTALTYSAATIDWTQNTTNATEGSWEVMFGESPLDITTASVTTLTDHVFNATNLTENTTYDFYVRANCGADGYSDWSSVYTFTTLCAPIAVTKYNPYIYGFEDVAGTGSTQPINACWAKGTNSSTAYPYPAATASYLNANTNPITPTNSYYLYMYGTATYYSYAVLPEFSNPLSSLQLSLKAMRTSSTSTYGVLQIGYMTDPTDINTFVMVQQVQPTYAASPNYNWQTFTTYFDNVNAPAGARMAFMVPAASTNTTYVDDIEVMPIPTCRVATNLESENVYARTANLSWTENSLVTPAAWEVRYAPIDADIDYEGVSVYPTGTAAVALSNLIPETDYQWKVRSICVAAANYQGDTADWSSVATFTTTATCVVPTVNAPVTTSNSVVLSWTENTLPVAATQWEVAVGETGFNQNIAGQHFTTGQNTGFLVEGLSHSTSYQVYVRSLCSDEDWSQWSEPVTFNTSCAPWQYADMPLVQSLATTSLPVCWTLAGGQTYFPGHALNIYNANSMLLLPQMGFALDTIEMTFEAANYDSYNEQHFQVGYLADGLDTTTFTAVETITINSPDFSEFNVSFADINNTTGRYIAIRGLSAADFNIRNVQVKLREPISYLPSTETQSNCVVFYMADTVNHEGTYAGNVNMTQTIYSGQPGKVLHLTGIMDCENGYDYLTIYEGVGTNGTILYQGTGYDANIDIKSTSYDWVNKGAMTIVFTSDIDNADQYLGFKLLAQCECPAVAPQHDWVVDTNTAFTWVNGRTYSNNVTVANQADKSWTEEYMEKNVGGCDSVYHTLQLTVHPTYTLTASKELCQRESYEFYGETLTATGSYTRSAQTIYGADSTTTLSLQVHPAPTAYIYVNNERTNGTIDAFCDNADLVMTARATIEGSAFKWEDNSTAAVRTVNPHETANYSVVAYDPSFGCPSLPVDLAVTTTPVPALTVTASNEAICVGGTTTLTVSDANNTGCTYSWSNGQTGDRIEVSPTTTTEYTVTATTPNASACTATASATIKVNALPVVNITPSATQICRYDSLTLTATVVDGYTYNWTNINNAASSTVKFVPANTGSYNLTVTDANGCTDNFTSSTVVVRPAYNINDTLSICAAMLPYTWGTQTLTDVNGGDYVQSWSIAYGCDSTVNLHLDVTATGVSNAFATYCEGDAFTFGQGQYQTNHVADLNVTSLNYIDSTSEECPVLYNLYLTINPKKASSFEANECDSYTWNNVEYTTAGAHTQTLQTIEGCDSVVTLNLTLRASTTGTDVQTVCDKLVWIDGNTYTENNTTAQHTIQNVAGCDSLVTLNLTVNYANTGVDNIRWCNTPTYKWRNGVTYDMNETDGNVRFLLDTPNQYGCDSTQILNLVFNLAADTMVVVDTTVCDIFILDTVACDGSLVECQINQNGLYELKTSIGNGRYVVSRYNVTISTSEYHTQVVRNQCLPYIWKDANENVIAVVNEIYNTTGDTNISQTFAQTASGCDRTEVLRLINAKPQTYNYVDAQVCLGETFEFNDYTVNPTVAGTETYRWPTGYTNANGCDSTDVVTLTTFPNVEEEMDVTLCEKDFVLDTNDNAFHYMYYNEDNTDSVDLTFTDALNGQVYNGSAVADWKTENGCDRTVTVNFTVNPTTNSLFETVQTYTYTWNLNGETYTGAGSYTADFVWGENQYGCDSIITLNLTLYDTVYNIIDTTVCTSYKGPDGETYLEDKDFVDILHGASQHGTDSVVVVRFHVNQNPLTDVFVASTDPYTWIDGVEYTNSGDAFFLTHDVNGCDSTLHLFFTKLDTIVLCEDALPYVTDYGFSIIDAISNTYSNNDAMGNDTIVSYTINLQTHDVIVDTACDNFTWARNNVTYNESGVYFYDYTNVKGCASADTLKLTVFHNTNSGDSVTACDSYTWTNNGNTVTKTVSGTYYSNYLTADECPSVDTLYLTINYNTDTVYNVMACANYTWNDSTYDASGVYAFEYTATNGCPSVDSLYLTIGNKVTSTFTASACDTYTWALNGQTYTASNSVDSVVLRSVFGCDSVVTLNLTMKYNSNTGYTEEACDTYTWNNNDSVIVKTVSGVYTNSYRNTDGCPSVDTLYLTVKYNTNSSYTEVACNSYEWTNNGNTITSTVSDTLYSSYTNTDNCPSVDTLFLTVNYSSSYDTTIYSSEGFYQFHYVANDVTYDTLFQANTPTTFGPLTATITNVAGCDSVINFTFFVGTTRNRTEVVVACQEYTWPRNNVTYLFINAEESAANHGALYKTSTGTYIYEAPIVTVNSGNAIDSTFILQLVLTERYTGTADTTLLLSNETLALGDSIFDFSAQKARGYRGYTENVRRDVHFTSTQSQYCDSVITYNISLIYNYDTTWMDICADQTSVVWGTQTIATTNPGSEIIADSTGIDGWFRTLVINQKPVYASTMDVEACDSYTWVNDSVYTADNNTATYVYPYNGCDSTVTLNLTLKHNSNASETAVACDTYTWTNNGNTITSTVSDTLYSRYNNNDNCPSVDTLYLTINKNMPVVLDTVACDSFTWTDGDGITYTTSGIHTNSRTDANTCVAVDTLKLTINSSNEGIDEIAACDSLTWIDGITYYINNYTAQHTVQNVAGCDSLVTLNLTINHATHNITVKADACDNYVWETSGQNYIFNDTVTYPLIITHDYVNGQNCASVDTLKLTLHKSSSETFDTTVCDTYTWINNGNTITKTESGIYTSNYINGDGCASTDMLYLTINHATTGYDTIVANNGYYTYDNVLYTADRHGEDVFDTTFSVASGSNVGGCDSTTMLYLLVGTNAIGMENQVVCDHFTWINGKTYEYRENAPAGALYWNATDNEWVYSRPRYTLPGVTSANGFDTIAVLNLTLTQIKYEEQNVRFLLSQGICYLTSDSSAAYSIDFTGAQAGTLDTAFHFGVTRHFCDSVITYHITLVDNYTLIGNEDICATATDYTWNDTNILGGHIQNFDLSSMITDFDHVSVITLTDTVFKGNANNEWVYAKTLTVHPMVYATERRTVCDSLRWNGTLFTESTTTATRFFPNGSSFGCDSTVTLNLTVKYNSSTAYDAEACNSYTWGLNNQTYTTSGDYTRAYTATNGCPSVDTLHLTVNYKGDTTYTVTACDSYNWNGTRYTTSGRYGFEYFTTAGCASVDSLYLTVNYNSNKGETKVICDSYTWHDSTYTASTTAFYSYTNAENGCPSVDTLYLTINKNNGQTLTESVCDSYTWAVDGQTYTQTGVYTFDSTDANGCFAQCKLDLTVGYTTNNAETAVACHSYDWNNETYTTSGVKTHSYINDDGCPSVDTLHLTINNQTTYAVQDVENCGPYTWIVNDSVIGVIDQSVETSTSFVNPRTMCDSVVFLRLTVYEAPHAYETATVCADALPYTWRGIQFAAAGDTAITTAYTDNCDSTIHFALTVNPLINVELTDAICLGNDYKANGFVIAASELSAGTHVFSNTVPSVLTGCDSTTKLTITVGDVIYNDAVEVTACDTYSWTAGDGETYVFTNSGTYNSGAYANALGCTSIDVLALTINNNSSTAYNATACDTYTWNNAVYNTTGDYTFAYNDGNGCASVDTLHLTINNNSSTGYSATACNSYNWNGETYTTSGDYIFEYNTLEGCHSVDTLHLTVNYSSYDTYTATACDSYEWNGTTYTVSGINTYAYNNVYGCASVDTLHLTVNYNTNSSFTAAACESYTWNGTTYNVSGDYMYSYNNAAGCASVDTLHLTVNYNSSTGYTVTACDSYEWHGQTFTSTGNYYYPYNTTEGCASLDTLHLTVNYNSSAVFTETACDSYTWNGTTYTTSGDYTFSYNTTAGCASVDTLHLTVNYNSNSSTTAAACDSYTWNGTDYTTTGVYYYNYNTAAGCASVDTLFLTVKYNTNKQRTIIACDEYTWMGETYYQSGDYLYSYEATSGCPSTDTLHLTVNYSTSTRTDIATCDSYEWNNVTYTVGGIYTFDYVATNNCESTDTLVLTLGYSANSNFDAQACNFYIWDGRGYTETGVYTYTYTGATGCDSVVTMNLTVNTQKNTSENATACGSYTWNGVTYNASGIYTYNTTSAAGCDSIVTLTLTINQPKATTIMATACDSYTWKGTTYTTSGNYNYTTSAANGCDSVVTLVLTVNNSNATSQNVTACDSYTWNGNIYTTSGSFNYTTTNINGCDSVVTLNLTVNNSTSSVVEVSTCGSFTWMNGQTYTASTTTPTVTLVNANGCDSVITLHLVINPAVTGDAYASACGSYTWEGTTYTVGGNYTHSYTTTAGCDSIVTMHLTINQPTSSNIIASACGSYTWEGATYTNSGNYTHTYTAVNGCDSVVTLQLTINQPTSSSFNATACGSYTWEGTTYTTSGVYTHNYTAANTCDSVVTMILTINQPVTSTVYATACDSYTWDNDVYAVSGNYSHTYTALNGCDSVVTLVLTVNNSVSVVEEVTECDGFVWINGVNYTESTTTPTVTLHTANGCDSVITLHLTINHSVEIYDSIELEENQLPYNYYGNTITAAGDYVFYGTTVTGCDSTVYLNVTVKTRPEAIDVTSALESITVYPNPTRGQSTVTADDVISIEVYDIVGKLVAKFENTNKIDISNLAEGSYTLRINTTNGTAVRRLIKK